ncbi:RidA family protein [Streptomyces sp. NPDC021080]|uniref:RidA family protein n=1 Tax=Streptomyces sp. NPDC021080 TaxID=3365110 RepID=UPI003798EE5A
MAWLLYFAAVLSTRWLNGCHSPGRPGFVRGPVRVAARAVRGSGVHRAQFQPGAGGSGQVGGSGSGWSNASGASLARPLSQARRAWPIPSAAGRRRGGPTGHPRSRRDAECGCGAARFVGAHHVAADRHSFCPPGIRACAGVAPSSAGRPQPYPAPWRDHSPSSRGMMQHFVRPDSTPPVNGYSHAVAFTGPMAAVSGQVPVDAEGRVVGAGAAEAQVRQVFANLATALAAAGAGMEHVVELTVYLTDLADLDTFRQVRDEYLDRPARRPAHWSGSPGWSILPSGSRSTHSRCCPLGYELSGDTSRSQGRRGPASPVLSSARSHAPDMRSRQRPSTPPDSLRSRP